MRINHDVSVGHVPQAPLLLLAEQPADGRLDAFLLLVAVDGPESPVSGATCATRVCVCVCSAVTNG